MEFTRNDTLIAKGIAISLMLIHHLYAFKHRILDDNSYIPILVVFDLEKYVGEFGKICVSVFLFLSGYGLFLSASNYRRNIYIFCIKKLKDFYLTYWIYFLIFVPLGLFIFNDVTHFNSNVLRYKLDIEIILKNWFGFSASFNDEWWFVKLYIAILILFYPLYFTLLNRHEKIVIVISLILFSVSKFIGFIGFYFFWQLPFMVGIFFAKHKLFEKELFNYLDKLNVIWVVLFCMCFIIRFKFNADIDFMLAPFFIYFTIRLAKTIKTTKLLKSLGRYSFPIWLIHSFFCYYYFQDLIYYPKYSLIVFILLAFCSFAVSWLTENLRVNFNTFIIHRFSRKF